jgi:hypothetical protein
MNQGEYTDFSEMLVTVSEYYGKPLKAPSIALWWNALKGCELAHIRGALNAHVQTSRFMATIADVLDALKAMDGRPDVEEAWSICAKSLNDEGVTIVWTQEMATAFGVALGLQDDRIAARMAFKEAYQSAVAEARKRGIPAQWTASLGHDPHGRIGPVEIAVQQGRLAPAYALALLPDFNEKGDRPNLLQ